jgi:hypothetical protein
MVNVVQSCGVHGDIVKRLESIGSEGHQKNKLENSPYQLEISLNPPRG